MNTSINRTPFAVSSQRGLFREVLYLNGREGARQEGRVGEWEERGGEREGEGRGKSGTYFETIGKHKC